MELYLITPAVILLFVLVGYLARKAERKAYNNGICPKCYGKLIQFDTDSQGGRMFKCENRDYWTDVSYPGIVDGG